MSPNGRGTLIGRRGLLALAGLGVLGTGCDRALSFLTQDEIPTDLEPPDTTEIDATHHLLDRIGFGPWPGQRARVERLGKERYLDEQLAPASVDDLACTLRTEGIDTIHLPIGLLNEFPPEEIERSLQRHTLLRATYSKRQLEEVMVEFWSDHFNVHIGKSLCRQYKTYEDRTVVRAHALGRFRDLLSASALSPAMLVYLDGRENKKSRPEDRPNENYARELFELHTLGVHGGYSQADVMDAARCLTGFVVEEEWAPGEVRFIPERHDDGPKTVLGVHIPGGGGRGDIERLLDIVSDHPSTSAFLAKKLASAFVSDDPPSSLVDEATRVWRDSRGDIAKVVRAIVMSEEFESSRGAKIKRPFRYVVSALRASAADTHAKGDLFDHLTKMGQVPFSHPTPDGFPARGDAWFGTLMWRFSFALSLASGRIDGVRNDWDKLLRAGEGEAGLTRHLFGRRANSSELGALDRTDVREERLALLLASPRFQRH